MLTPQRAARCHVRDVEMSEGCGVAGEAAGGSQSPFKASKEYLDFLKVELCRLEKATQKCKRSDRWFALRAACGLSEMSDGRGLLWLEFGVFSGESVALMATHPHAPPKVFGFDSFIGLPAPSLDGRTDWTTQRFDRGGELPSVPPNVELVPGWFSDTLPAFTRRADCRSTYAGLIHIDSDIYSSCAFVLATLTSAGLVRRGTVIVFDELLHYPGWHAHEFKALFEWSRAWDVSFEWVAIKDRVYSCFGDEASDDGAEVFERRNRAMPHHKSMRAQGFDQSAALIVTHIALTVKDACDAIHGSYYVHSLASQR